MTIPGTVSVIVPCFNAARYVDEALRSIRSQTYPEIDIIAVNDGSTDDTQRLLEEHARSDSRVRIFSQPNRGLSAARNTGLKNVRGEFVSFLDADDVILPEKLEKQVRYLLDNPAIDLVYSDYFDGDSRLDLTGLVVIRIPGKNLLDAYAVRNCFACMVPLVRRTMIDKVGEFDESLRASEDWDYWIRCAKVGA